MRALFFILLAASCCWLPTGLQAQSSQAPVAEAPPVPVFQAGDAVRVTVWRNSELSGQFDIAEDGTIIHPLYRSIRAAGVPVTQVESEIRMILQRFETNPEMVVEPLFRVAIGGQVRSPNIYILSPATTIFQAITQAGGPNERANLDRVRLLRDGSTSFVDLTRPAHELTHLRIRSGDQIIVDSRRNLWVDTVSPALSVVGSVASLAYVLVRVLRYY